MRVAPTDVDEVLTAAKEFRKVVVVTREAHRYPSALALLSALDGVDYVRVETGLPDFAWRPAAN